MRLDRRPLLETSIDGELFVDRAAELDRILRGADLGLNVALGGAAGSGRTSLLRRLVFRLRQAERTVVFVGAAGMDSPEAVLHRVLRRVAGDQAAAVAAFAGLDADALLARLADVLPPGRVVIVVDDLAVLPGRALFGMLRDEVWRLPVTWVVSAEEVMASLLRPPVDAFFEVIVELAPLAPDELAEVLRRRLDGSIPASDVSKLAELAGGSPRLAIDLARAVVVEGRTVDAVRTETARRSDRLADLSEPASTLARLVEQLGPVSPSDVDLQRRMGVSRPRLVTLFGELRDAGLVREVPPDRDGAPGRPRIRFASTGATETVGGVRDPSD